MEWINLLRDIGVLTIVAYLAQKFIDHQFSQHQQKLLHEIESFKETLHHSSYKKTRLHDRRIQAIENINTSMVDLESALRQLVGIRLITGDKVKDDEEWHRIRHTSSTAYNGYLAIYFKEKLYLPEATATMLEAFRKAAFDSILDIDFNKDMMSEDAKEAFKLYKTAAERIRSEIPKITSQLERDFRQLLGE